jgi:hypothetical protein
MMAFSENTVGEYIRRLKQVNPSLKRVILIVAFMVHISYSHAISR